MTIADRYIGTVLARDFVYALAALVSIFSVLTFAEELRGSDLGIGRAAGFVLMTLPAQAYALLPASAILGTTMGLGQMMRYHELIALQAAGISRVRLAAAVLGGAVLIAVVGMVWGEMIAAPLSQRAHARRALAESGGRTLSTTAGLWVRDGSRFVNIAEVHADGSLVGIHIFDFADVHTLRRFIRAGRAVRDGNQWTLADVQESLLHDDSATIRRVAQQPWDTSIDTGRLKALWMRPEDISARELYRTIGWLERYQQNPLRYELAFWRRITTPLYTVLMVMLAVPIVMMSSPRAPIGEHIVRGAAIGIGFQMAQQTFSNYGLVAGLPPLLTALAPAVMALAAIVMLFRLHVTE